MKTDRRFLIVVPLAMALVGTSASGQAIQGKFGDLLERIPDSTNALMLVDVEGLLNSKIGVREQWRKKPEAAAAWGIHFPVNANKVVKAASIDLESGSERWTLGLVAINGAMPDMASLAQREHGHVDMIQGMQVVRTPRNLYLFGLPPGLLGYATPADRQLLDQWIRLTITKPRTVVPQFADRAIYRADRTAQVAIALNLENAISTVAAENAIKNMDIIKKLKFDIETVSRPISSAKSAILTIEVKEEIRGEIRIDFDQSVEVFREGAKEMVLTALDAYGTDLADFARWGTVTEGSTITLSGPLSKESFRRILTLVAPPQLDSSYSSASTYNPDPAAANAPPRPSPEQEMIEGSQRYFHAIVDLLDGLKGEKSTSYNGMRMWYDRYARRMDELPILNVDKELIDFGADTSRILREMASGINYTAQNRIYRLSNSANGGYYWNFASGKSYDFGVIKKQENALLSVQMDGKWQGIDNAIGEMRRRLVERYKVEF